MSIDRSLKLAVQLTVGIEQLLLTLDGNEEKLREVIATFISNTPGILDQIDTYIRDNKATWAAALVHKVKTRYGYFGLDDVVADLTIWERELLMNVDRRDNAEMIKNLKKLNEAVVDELSSTPFYDEDEPEDLSSIKLHGKCVMIAEDDEVNAMVFELFVKETGATAIIARDGVQALELALAQKPDLIFMDVHMPFFSGLEAIRELRSQNITCPIISLSASSRLNERQNSLDAGADEFLIKPANRESITKALFRYLR